MKYSTDVKTSSKVIDKDDLQCPKCDGLLTLDKNYMSVTCGCGFYATRGRLSEQRYCLVWQEQS